MLLLVSLAAIFCYNNKRQELRYSLTAQEEVQPGCTRSAARLYKKKYSQAVQEVQPGCTRGSAARLYKRKCNQTVV